MVTPAADLLPSPPGKLPGSLPPLARVPGWPGPLSSADDRLPGRQAFYLKEGIPLRVEQAVGLYAAFPETLAFCDKGPEQSAACSKGSTRCQRTDRPDLRLPPPCSRLPSADRGSCTHRVTRPPHKASAKNRPQVSAHTPPQWHTSAVCASGKLHSQGPQPEEERGRQGTS